MYTQRHTKHLFLHHLNSIEVVKHKEGGGGGGGGKCQEKPNAATGSLKKQKITRDTTAVRYNRDQLLEKVLFQKLLTIFGCLSIVII